MSGCIINPMRIKLKLPQNNTYVCKQQIEKLQQIAKINFK